MGREDPIEYPFRLFFISIGGFGYVDNLGGDPEVDVGRDGVRRCRSAARAISTATTTSSGGGRNDPLGVFEFLYASV